MGKRSFTNGVVGVLAITAIAGCGDMFTLAPSSASSGSGASSGTSGGGSASTSSASGGGGAGGNAGACTPGELETCNENQYCQRTTKICAECKDVSSPFIFGPPIPLELSLPNGGTNPRFPRSGPNGQLLFTFTSLAGNLNIGHAPAGSAPLTWQKGQSESEPPLNTSADESSSFYLAKGSVLKNLVDPNVKTDTGIVLYDSTQQGPGTKQVFAFNPDQTSFSKVQLQGGTINSQLTVAADVPRFWYTSNALKPASEPNEFVELVSAAPGTMPTAVPLQDSAGCAVKGNVAPWVTPDGTILLFATQRQKKIGTTCSNVGSDTSHLWYTTVNPKDGKQAEAAARELFSEDPKSYTSPALSENLCVLYFFEATSSTSATLYAAIRE